MDCQSSVLIGFRQNVGHHLGIVRLTERITDDATMQREKEILSCAACLYAYNHYADLMRQTAEE